MEKQAVQSENDRLKLQIDSVQAQNRIEQKKAGEDRLEKMHTQTRINRKSDCLILKEYFATRKMNVY